MDTVHFTIIHTIVLICTVTVSLPQSITAAAFWFLFVGGMFQISPVQHFDHGSPRKRMGVNSLTGIERR